MPSKVCNQCGMVIKSHLFNKHRQRHRQRPPRQLNGRSGSTRAWRKLRKQIIARDGGHCAHPGCSKRHELEVHHLDGDWRNDHPANLITLCRFHHPR